VNERLFDIYNTANLTWLLPAVERFDVGRLNTFLLPSRQTTSINCLS